MNEIATQELLQGIATEFSRLPEVRAAVLAGSKAGKLADERSDIDLYIYADTEPAEIWRAGLASRFGETISIGNRFWETGDEWVAKRTGTVVDIMYRSPDWISDQLDRVLVRQQASVGYSTCFVYNVLHSSVLYDVNGWYAALQARAAQPYPEGLRRAIVAKNHPILRSTLSSYRHQIALALARNDHVSVNHRVTALLASYFDILFAVNRLFHPGEKRLVAYVLEKCPRHPPDLQARVEELLHAAEPSRCTDMLGCVDRLLDDLDQLLLENGLIAN